MLALFGIGQLGQKLYLQLKKQGIIVDFLLDNHKNDTFFHEIKIKLPLNIEAEVKAKTTVIITTFKQELQKNELNELKELILSLGFKEVLNIQEAINRFNLNFEYFYVGKFDKEREELASVLNLLSDENSKKIFHAHVDFRVHGNVEVLYQYLTQEDQYVPDFFVNHLCSLEIPLTVIDCGACYGDLLNSTLQKSITIGEYIAFEPDKNNREVLVNMLRKSEINSIIIPLGVGDKEVDLKFASGEGMASHVDENGTDMIKIVPLDCILFGDIHLIKMDIEGFEQEALCGATRIIETFKPALAIALYHKPDDIITLPLYLAQYYSKFYIRQHGRYGFDLVLYCFN